MDQNDMQPTCFHLLISGFCQRAGLPTGMFRLKEEFRRNCHYCNARSITELYRWDSNWRWIAEDIWQTTVFGKRQAKVGVYAFSWGAGWGAARLARRLRRLGIRVRAMVLSDPVYRHPWLPLRWLSLLQRRPIFLGPPVIRVPDNVDEVFCFRQEMNRPQGHHLVCDGDTTLLHPPVLLDRVHDMMDDAPAFHAQALAAAETLREESGIACPLAGSRPGKERP